MKLTRRFRTFAAVFALAGVLTTSATCGYILHPERRGQAASGQLDVAVVVMDILWFIPGLIPGVIAVVIDAAYNTWYTGGGRASNEPTLAPGAKLAIEAPATTKPATYTIRMRDANGRVLETFNKTVTPADTGKKFLFDPSRGLAKARMTKQDHVTLELEMDGRLVGVKNCRVL